MPNLINNIETIEKQLVSLRKLIIEITASSGLDMVVTIKTMTAKKLFNDLENLYDNCREELECEVEYEADRKKLLNRMDVIYDELMSLRSQIAPTPRVSTCITPTENRTIVGYEGTPYRRFSCLSQDSSVFRSSNDEDAFPEFSAPHSGILSPL